MIALTASSEMGFLETVVETLSNIWEYFSLTLEQIVGWFRLVFTTWEMTNIIPDILPTALSSIAILTIGAAVVKAIFGR